MYRYSRRILLIGAIALSVLESLGAASPESNLESLTKQLDFYYFFEIVLLAGWLTAEPRVPAENRPTFDHGYLHMATFPILAIYEQYVSRGWKGVAIVVGFLFLLFAPILVWGITHS